MTDWDRRVCAGLHKGGDCTRVAPCIACFNARSRALLRVGYDFPSLGCQALRGINDNA